MPTVDQIHRGTILATESTQIKFKNDDFFKTINQMRRKSNLNTETKTVANYKNTAIHAIKACGTYVQTSQ